VKQQHIANRKDDFEEHFNTLKYKDSLLAIPKCLGLSKDTMFGNRLFRYTVQVIEDNPIAGILVHEKDGTYDTCERCIGFVGYVALSITMSFVQSMLSTPDEAVLVCYHSGYTGCTTIVDANRTQLEICNTWLAEAPRTSSSCFDDTNLAWVGPNATLDQAKACAVSQLGIANHWMLWAVLTPIISFFLFSWLTEWILGLKTKCLNCCAYVIILLQVAFMGIAFSAFLGVINCKAYGDVSGVGGPHLLKLIFGSLVFQTLCVEPVFSLVQSMVLDEFYVFCYVHVCCCCQCCLKKPAGHEATAAKELRDALEHKDGAVAVANPLGLQNAPSSAAESAASALAAGQQMEVTVPAGATAGQVIQVMTPDSVVMEVAVPAGAPPGSTFLVNLAPGEANALQKQTSEAETAAVV
jgi:hypothetical protein